MNHDLKLVKAVLHVLDLESNLFVPSGRTLEMTDDLSEYILKHLHKILSDSNLKKARFTNESNPVFKLCTTLNEDNFLDYSLEMAFELYTLMQKHVDISSADVIICLFEENGTTHLGLLKLNYKTGFTHWVNNEPEGNVNTIIRHKTLLPLEGQKIDECVLINLADYSLRILEKQFEINGQKEFYLSKYYLEITSDLSTNEKLKILDKVAKNINKKYFDEDFEKSIQVKKAFADSLEENETIKVEQVAKKVYEKNADIREEYMEELSKAGLVEKEISIPEKVVEKKFSVQKIKTDTGIEINFPIDYANRTDRIEFINQPDGTFAIVIKNVARISHR